MFDLLGPQVAIIDDIEVETTSITNYFKQNNVGNIFFKVDPIEPVYPLQPIDTVELVFLDLHYNTGFGASFEPYTCCEWLRHVVPAGKRYILIIWSKDTDKKDALLAVMEDEGMTLPFMVEMKNKSTYRVADNEYNIQLLLDELGISYQNKVHIDIQEIYGRVIKREEDKVLINCLIYNDPITFEVRRFDLKPFVNHIELESGIIILIRITTSPGSRVFEFIPVVEDMNHLFEVPDDFDDIEDIEFLNG